jgi:Right handed beta helix region
LTTFPDASTTGVPAGTSLTAVNGDFTSSYAGQIIDARDVSGTIFVHHPDVTIRNCQVGRIFVTETGSNVTIEDSEIVGNPSWNSGITILAPNGTVRGCDISGVERGIWLESDNSLIENNYLHNLINNTGTHDPHIDGIQIPGARDVIIRNNNLDLARNVSASITMKDATNVDIYDNHLSGGTYVIYFEGNTTGSNVTNNVFGEYYYGYIAGAAHASQTYSGNVYGDTAVSTSPPPAVTTDTSAPSVDPVAPAAPAIATQTTNANGGQADSNTSYAGPIGWASPIGGPDIPSTTNTSAQLVAAAAPAAPEITTAVTAANSGQVDSSGSYAGPMGWAGLMASTGSHDTFAFAANFGRGVTSGFSASQGGPDIAVGQTVSQTAFNAFAADVAHAAPTPLGGQHLVDEDAFGLT